MKIRILTATTSAKIEKAFELWKAIQCKKAETSFHNISHNICPNLNGDNNRYMYSICVNYTEKHVYVNSTISDA